MSNYSFPGVYAENINNASAPIEGVGSSTGGFVGITVRGELRKPILVTSWQDFLDKFAFGVETPFIANSDLAYSVYGFFQNGGTKCYVIRVASSSAAKASGTLSSGRIYAKDEGTWGNKISVKCTANKTHSTLFDVEVEYDGERVELYEGLSNTVTDANYFANAIRGSKFITGSVTSLTATEEYVTLTGGNDGISDIEDEDFLANGLVYFDSVDDVSLICIPGQTSNDINESLVTYADLKGNVFAILDGVKTATVEDIIEARENYVGKNAALYYPWIKVSDPLSKNGTLRECPACGHIMGVYSRIIKDRGVWKAPAGTEAYIRGAIDVVKSLAFGEGEQLNASNVNAVLSKPGYGIVVWGARSINTDPSLRYVSDVLLKTHITESIKNGTQWAVFEPNNSFLWTKVKTTIEAFLDELWRAGGLKGETAAEAYFVKCDAELNTKEGIESGKLICDVGYAPNKPAEFVIVRIAHSISND